MSLKYIGLILLLTFFPLITQADDDDWISVVGEVFFFPDISSEPVDDSVVLPPVPEFKTQGPLKKKQLVLTSISLQGNTQLKPAQVEQILKPFIGIELSNNELHLMTASLTELYHSQGYLNSRVVLPDQSIKNSALVLQSIEGRIEEIKILGLNRLNAVELGSSFATYENKVFNYYTVMNVVDQLATDPRIERVDVSVNRGLALFNSSLHLKVHETARNGFMLGADNYKAPGIGSTHGYVQAYRRGLLSSYDELNLNMGLTEGVLEGLFRYEQNYYNRMWSMHYQRSHSKIVDPAFADLNLTNTGSSFGVRYLGAFDSKNGLKTGWQWQVGLNQKKSLSKIDGEPYSLDSQSLNGVSHSVTLGLGALYRKRHAGVSQVVNFGISYGQDINRFAQPFWLIQPAFIRQQRLALWQSFLSIDLRAQFASVHLLPTDKFSAGGSQSVRGYRENSLSRDQGLVLRMDWFIYPLSSRFGRLNWGPFVDYGSLWSRGEESQFEQLFSAGLGLMLVNKKGLNVRLDWGLPFIPLSAEYTDWQDAGLHASISYKF